MRVLLMWHHKIHKQFTVGLSCSLMMIIATIAIADDYIYQYSQRLETEQSNPWALPLTPRRFQEIPESWEEQYQGRQIQKYNRGFRFVTSEILESLKRQQTQTQLMSETTVTHH